MRAALICAAFLLCASGCGRREPDFIVIGGRGGPAVTERSGDGRYAVPAGEEFTVLRVGRDCSRGEALSRAEHLRDLELRERVGVSVSAETVTGGGEAAELCLAAAAAGDGVYALVIGPIGETGYPLLCSGALAEEGGCPDLRYSRFPESLGCSGRRLITGALAPGSYGDASCVLVNREAALSFGAALPAPGAEWTFDDMLTAAEAIPAVARTYRYGVADSGAGPAWVRAAGARLTEEADGRPLVCGEPTDRVKEAIRAAARVLGDERQTVWGPDAVRAFAAGEALFLFCRTGDAMALRETGEDFTITSYPSAGGGSGGYADSVAGEAAAIPSAGLDGARAGVIAEYDRLSGKYVDAERRDALLSGASAYDEESREAVDAILRGAEYELCEACGGGGLGDALGRALADPEGAIPSDYAGLAAEISAKLRRDLPFFGKTN